MAENKHIPPELPPIENMVVKTYRIAVSEYNDANAVSRKLYKKELSVLVREFVQKIAKKK